MRVDCTGERRGGKSRPGAAEYVIEAILRRRWNISGTDHEYLVKWERYDDQRDQTWVPHLELVGTDALAVFEARESANREAIGRDEPASAPERRMMYSIFNGLQNEAVPRSVTDSVYSILADAEPIGNGHIYLSVEADKPVVLLVRSRNSGE